MAASPLVRRWSVFTLVGFGGFVLQMAALAFLTRVCGWHYMAATVTGIELAILHNFLGDTQLTWRDRPAPNPREFAARFARYQLARTLVLVLNLGLTAIFVSSTGAPPEAANASAVILLSLVNFYLGDRFVFTRS
jgi:putative flippase GtrA